MTDFDDLLREFPPQVSNPNQSFTVFDTQPQREPTPQEKDLLRLEDEIEGIFANRQLLNNALATFLGVVGSGSSIHLFARLGIPAVATGTLLGIIIALAFGKALTKIGLTQGRPTIDGEFLLALTQALGVTGAMWLGARDYLALEGRARQGREQFLAEVKNFEMQPTSPDLGRLGTVGIGVVLPLVAIAVLKGGKRNGF